MAPKNVSDKRYRTQVNHPLKQHSILIFTYYQIQLTSEMEILLEKIKK